jgi:hypothetical protein
MSDPTFKTGTARFASPVVVGQGYNVVDDLCSARPCGVKASWWDVQVWGWTTEQTVPGAGGQGPFPDDGSLKSSGQRNVPIRARLQYEGDELDFDVGSGMRVSIYARNVTLSAVAPVGSIPISGPANSIGLVNNNPVAPIQQQNSLVYGVIGQVDSQLGSRIAKLTQVVSVVGAGQFVNVPARARRVQVFQNTAGGAPAAMNWNTNTLSLTDLGQIDFAAGSFHTDVLDVPGQAAVIAPGAGVRVLTFVWELEL